jgi:hypothetical protein
VGVRQFMRRADDAVQTTKASVTTGVALSVVAIVLAVVAIVVAVVRRLGVEGLGVFLAKHPALVGVAFGTLVGICGFNAFRAGVTYAQLRSAVADRAREASEALGG